MIKCILSTYNHLYEDISSELSSKLEILGKGRKGCIMADINDCIVPLIRSTTNYKTSTKPFIPLLVKLIDNIKTISKINLDFNNVMVEVYDKNYSKMGYHSDQGLDLADDSYICILSCYKEKTIGTRTLNVIDKVSKNLVDSLSMDNNSIIIFSTDFNKKHLHQIVSNNNLGSDWLGVTFRLSKTFINSPRDLKLASNEERNIFYKNKSDENRIVEYVYSPTNITVSEGDLLDYWS